MFELIDKLTKAFGVSGNEEDIRAVILEEIKTLVDETKVDTLGNLIGIKKGNGKKIMIAAHMDEIGVMVTFIDDKGFLRFSNIGGVSSHFSLGQKVRFKNGTLGCVFYEDKLEDMKSLKLSTMYIDIGAKNREEALKIVDIGDVAAFVGEARIQGDMIISKSIDDRAGCAVLIETLKNLPKTNNELYFVFTVQEELGLRGARTAAFGLMPDLAIAVDVTLTGDTPECRPMEVKMGCGPALKIKDASFISHPLVKERIVNAAKKNNIPLQYEVLERGGSDPGSIHITAGGIPSGAISLPCRYVHSPVETLSLSDLQDAVKLLTASIID